jgi:hypothetical protein
MSINKDRPGFAPNLQASLDAVRTDNVFVNIPEGQSMLFRFLPPSRADGGTWHMTAQHHNLKDDEDRDIAVADLSVHGNDETGTEDYINELVAVVKNQPNSKEWKPAKTICFGKKGIKTGFRYHGQVLVAEDVSDGTFKYIGPKILGLPPSGAKAINKLQAAQKIAREPSFNDPDSGFNVLIEHTKESPWYSAQRAGAPISLDDIYPEWTDKFFQDMEAKISIRLYTRDEQKVAVRRAYPSQFDWDRLEAEFRL